VNADGGKLTWVGSLKIFSEFPAKGSDGGVQRMCHGSRGLKRTACERSAVISRSRAVWNSTRRNLATQRRGRRCARGGSRL
jgi:hypothetical protein